MRILRASVNNFASYKKLDFDFTAQGLVLVEGPTGSGKSTLCDVIPWILFGKTAKGGAVDEVLSWPGDQVTEGTIYVSVAKGDYKITRKRGKAKDNDLHWCQRVPDVRDELRGKDLPDTQRLINNLLGMDYETYLAGAYFHEFSQTAQFFNTTAKNRRQITEQLVDLSLAINLQTKTQDEKKAKDKDLAALLSSLHDLDTEMTFNVDALERTQTRNQIWESAQLTKQIDIQTKIDKFEALRQSDLNEARRAIQVQKGLIETLPETDLFPKCPTCGQHTDSEEICVLRNKQAINDQAIRRIEHHSEKIKEIKLRANPYKDLSIKAEENPYTNEIDRLDSRLVDLTNNIDTNTIKKALAQQEVEDLQLLQEVLTDYRSTTIRNSIQGLQDITNSLLTDHFDAEIRVAFSAKDADKLEVSITKDGNTCVFSQLSKGQRGILKLCFGMAVMKAVANHNGTNFSQIFLDEALDGLDENMKVKAFGLLRAEAINRESVFVVEHSEALKPLFENTYSVSLINGISQIAKS